MMLDFVFNLKLARNQITFRPNQVFIITILYLSSLLHNYTYGHMEHLLGKLPSLK